MLVALVPYLHLDQFKRLGAKADWLRGVMWACVQRLLTQRGDDSVTALLNWKSSKIKGSVFL